MGRKICSISANKSTAKKSLHQIVWILVQIWHTAVKSKKTQCIQNLQLQILLQIPSNKLSLWIWRRFLLSYWSQWDQSATYPQQKLTDFYQCVDEIRLL